jgi:hypothetical protein
MRENPSGGRSFGRSRRWLGTQSPLRGFSCLAASAAAKIPCRGTPRIFQTRSKLLTDGQGEPGDFAVARHRGPRERGIVCMRGNDNKNASRSKSYGRYDSNWIINSSTLKELNRRGFNSYARRKRPRRDMVSRTPRHDEGMRSEKPLHPLHP